MNFGQWISEAEARRIMDSARGHGINYLDTANV